MPAVKLHRSTAPLRLALAILALAAIASLLGPGVATAQDDQNVIPGHYIVVLKDSVAHPGALAEEQTEQRDGDLGFVYRNALKGYSAELSQGAARALRSDPRVVAVRPDHYVVPAAQTTPTGVKRIFAPENASLDIDEKDDARFDVDVAVLDTGIDSSHPDLNVVERTYCHEVGAKTECVDNTGTDESSHGTHVAGTIAAIDNGSGVVGAAPGARLWSVKVLDPTGSEAQLVAGVEWVTSHAEEIEVANMSIGCEALPCSWPTLGEAIAASAQEGIVYVAAAGNNAGDVEGSTLGTSPYVITVSALADYDGKAGAKASPSCANQGGDDDLATFSNYGTSVDVAAPGVCIRSTVPGGGYSESFSGTSMASPHVAGAAAVLASRANPEDLGDVARIQEIVEEEGNLEWTDTSEDGWHEPLLDIGGGEFVPSAPTATTVTATNNTFGQVTLHGLIDPNGAGTKYRFEVGTTTSYGTNMPAPDVDSGLEKGIVSHTTKEL